MNDGEEKDIAPEEKSVTTKEFRQTQFVRVLDVVVIAPLLVYAGMQKSLPMWMRGSLITVGVLTAIYNGNNYLKNSPRTWKIKPVKNK